MSRAREREEPQGRPPEEDEQPSVLPETKMLSPEERANMLDHTMAKDDAMLYALKKEVGARAPVARKKNAGLRRSNRRSEPHSPHRGDHTQRVRKKRKVQNDPLIGHVIGNLQIVEVLGAGGYGSVYRAEHPELRTSFAIKMLNLDQQKRPDIIERFRREARSIAQIRHENVVQLSDFGWLEGYGYYIVMEYLDGDSLQMTLAKQRSQTLPLKRIMRVAKQLCSALQLIHQQGIVHRDIKPSNIILSTDHRGKEVAKLIDFGIATVEDEVNLTQSGVCLGSPTYMAPEQADVHVRDIDGRTDLYSLAIILYQCLTGAPPFRGKSFGVLIRQHAQDLPPLLQDVVPQRPWHPQLEEFFAIALSKSPEDRPKDAKMFWGQFKEAMTFQYELEKQSKASRKGAAFGMGEVDGGGRASQGRSILFWLAIVLGCVGLGVGVSWWVVQMRKGATKETPLLRRVVRGKVPAVRRKKPSLLNTKVSVMLHSNPNGAIVSVGDKVVGVTPCIIRGRPGETVSVVMRLPEYKPRTFSVTFTTQRLRLKAVELQQ
ncbi:MAG TPA: hypothetical protein DCE42_18865 [Myxococcales bacterium]|nr:hypothetical protein [Deltaproteobacteria bacterium]HAA56836.1 hypothetical protein [Myxococcales bacterium]|tara:strand:- start:28451 stop:30082 length:1632 start_codon:yes stop_codon:yes gene_type:complete